MCGIEEAELLELALDEEEVEDEDDRDDTVFLFVLPLALMGPDMISLSSVVCRFR